MSYTIRDLVRAMYGREVADRLEAQAKLVAEKEISDEDLTSPKD